MLLAGSPARLLLRAAGMPLPLWHVLMCAVLTVTIDAPHPSAPRLAWLGWAGDPVNTGTGMFVYTRLDLAMRTPQGAVLAFTRAHSSFDTRVTALGPDRKSTRLNSSHVRISYAVFCLKKKKKKLKKSVVTKKKKKKKVK